MKNIKKSKICEPTFSASKDQHLLNSQDSFALFHSTNNKGFSQKFAKNRRRKKFFWRTTEDVVWTLSFPMVVVATRNFEIFV